jgi:hypothetical protein
VEESSTTMTVGAYSPEDSCFFDFPPIDEYCLEEIYFTFLFGVAEADASFTIGVPLYDP